MNYISQELRKKIHQDAGKRCGYCLGRQEIVLGILEIDHIIPIAEGGTNDEDNLWLACRACNLAKSKQTFAYDPQSGRRVRLFNPRSQNWWEHFCWSESGIEIIGKTPVGRATVVALNLNNTIALMTLLIYPLFEKIMACKFNICVAKISKFGLYQRRH
jgi:hypothetical protein